MLPLYRSPFRPGETYRTLRPRKWLPRGFPRTFLKVVGGPQAAWRVDFVCDTVLPPHLDLGIVARRGRRCCRVVVPSALLLRGVIQECGRIVS